MLNKKIITIGIVAVVALAVFYFGNLVMKTTPSGDAGGTYQYKVADCNYPLEDQLNQLAKDGWEFVGGVGRDNCHLIFRKK